MRRTTLVVTSVAYLGAVGWLTFDPSPPSGELSTIVEVMHRIGAPAWFTPDVGERVFNVVMFVPFGVLGVAAAGRHWLGRVIIAGAVFSGLIESTQALLLPLRSADPVDVVMNTTGAAVGALLAAATAVAWPRLVRRFS